MDIRDLINRPTLPKFTPKVTEKVSQKINEVVRYESVAVNNPVLDKLKDTTRLLEEAEKEISETIQHVRDNSDSINEEYFTLVEKHRWDPLTLLTDKNSRPTYPPSIVYTQYEKYILENSEDRRAPFYQELHSALEFNQMLRMVVDRVYNAMPLENNHLTKFALQQIYLQGIDNLNFTNIIYNLQTRILDDYSKLGNELVRDFFVDGKIDSEYIDQIKRYTSNLGNLSDLNKDLKTLTWANTMGGIRLQRGNSYHKFYQLTLDNLAIQTLAKSYDKLIESLDSDVQQALGALFSNKMADTLEKNALILFARAEEGLVRQYVNQIIRKDSRDLLYKSTLSILDSHSLTESLKIEL